MRLLTLFIASLVSAHGDLKAAIGKPAPDFTAEAVVNGDFQKVYSRVDSMNGTPTASWQRLCAIDRVKLLNQVSKVREIPIPRN